MTPAELRCLIEGLSGDHEWFDVATDERPALVPSNDERLPGSGRPHQVKCQAIHPLKESLLLIGLAHLCPASSTWPWILCASGSFNVQMHFFDAGALCALIATGTSAQSSLSRRIAGASIAFRSQFALRLWQSVVSAQALAVRGRGLERGEV
jgi:hypothetical protein